MTFVRPGRMRARARSPVIVASGGSAPWTPPSAVSATLLAWYRSDTVVLSGSNVTQWTDKSGNGNHIVPGGTLPVWSSSSPNYNSKPILTNVAATTMSTPSLTFGPFTFGYVARQSGGFVLNGNGNYNYNPSGDTIRAARGGSASGKNATTTWMSGSVAVTGVLLFDGTHAGHILRVNGAALSMTDVSGETSDPGTGTQSGTMAFMSGVAGDMAEFIVYNASINSTDQANLESYLRGEYATW